MQTLCLFFSDDYTLHVRVSDQHDTKDVFVKVSVRLLLKRLLISSSLPLLVDQRLFLEASAYPTTRDVSYAWDFGDGSGIVRDTQQNATHSFQAAGLYNITVSANNTVSAVSTWSVVEVLEGISGLAVTNSGPSELDTATSFKASVATGTGLTWAFDFADGSPMENLTDPSVSHVYKSPGIYTVKVVVFNSISQACGSSTAEVYRISVSGILPVECICSGRDTRLTALVSGNVSALSFHWLFGDGSPGTTVKGQSAVTHAFRTPGTFYVNLTVSGAVALTSFGARLCVEVEIGNVTVVPSQEVAAAGAEVCFRALVFPERTTGCELQWLSGPSSLVSRAEDDRRCFVFRGEGIEEISVTAKNNVSAQTAKSTITIQKPVGKFSAAHDIQGDALMVGAAASFWVVSCVGTNVSVLWDFGDGSPLGQMQNATHVFPASGDFKVTATASNAISRDSVSFHIKVLLPISDLSIHLNPPYSVAGEQTVFTALSSAIGNTTYFWSVGGINSSVLGSHQLRFTFLNPGVYQVRVIAMNLVGKEEAAISVEVFERIEGLQIESQAIIGMKYVPTGENLLFVPSVSKGSNVSYHWVATRSKSNQDISGDGDFFQISAETPGGMSVHVRASNVLGEAISNLSLEAVDRVRGAVITSQSNVVALGESVNISVSVTAGSDLKYFWHVKPDHPPVETQAPFLLHVFTSVGHCSVDVSVRNALSWSNVTKGFTVQEEVHGVDFQIDGGTRTFYVPAKCAVTLHGLCQKGSDLHWSWNIGDAMTAFLKEQTSIYSFPHAGIYQVSLNVSNWVNWQTASHNVTVQDPIEELVLNVSNPSFCRGEEVTFVAEITSGSEARFVITFKNGDWIYSQDIPGGCLTTSSLPAGTLLVTVKAWNQVSSAEVSSRILIRDGIQGLKIVNCCPGALEAEKGTFFKSEVQSRDPVDYTWVFHLVGFEPVQFMGQEVFFTPPGSGPLAISVQATDGVCSESVNGTTRVQWPVEDVSLMCHSDRVFVGHAATFSADVLGGGNVTFLWDFGDAADPLATDSGKVSYTYAAPGEYTATVRALNSVSRLTARLHVEVETLQCSSPQVSLVLSGPTILRSRSNYFEASVVSNCSAYDIRYRWEALSLSATGSKSTLSGNKVGLGGGDTTSPLLLIPKRTLSVGQYCLLFTVSLQGTPVHVQRNATITVVNSPLVAVIKGGSRRLWPRLADLLLDGSESRDPDREPGEEETLEYDWAFATLVNTSRF